MATAPNGFYPYLQLGTGGGAASYAGVQYPQMFHYSTAATTAEAMGFGSQHYGGPISAASTAVAQAGLFRIVLMVYFRIVISTELIEIIIKREKFI